MAQPSTSVQAGRTDLTVTLTAAEAGTEAGSFVVEIGDRAFTAPIQADGTASVVIPYAAIEALPVLSHRMQIMRDGEATELPPAPALNLIDIRDRKLFMERVQSLSKRIRDPELVRFCARRQLAIAEPFDDVAGASLCAIGYRIVEGLDRHDADFPRFWQWVERFLAETPDQLDEVRWITSVTMVATYAAILEGSAEKTLHHLRKTLSYRRYLPRLSLLHTNFSRCNILLALLEASRGRVNEADQRLADVDDVFHGGVAASWIDHPQRGRSQYSEIFAVLKSVRLAHQLRDRLRGASTPEAAAELARRSSIGSVTVIWKKLEETGSWKEVLDAAARLAPEPDLPASGPSALSGSAEGRDDGAAERFRRDVAALASAADQALEEDDQGFTERHGQALILVMEADAALRERGEYIWPALLELSRIRLYAAHLAAVGDDTKLAYTLLTGTTRWTKQVLEKATVERDQDFETAGLFVQSGLINYILAHRYVVPEAKLLADRFIEEDLLRNMRRVLASEGAITRVVAVFKEVAERAVPASSGKA